MKALQAFVAAALAVATLAGCDRPVGNTAYNNSGASASSAPAQAAPDPLAAANAPPAITSPLEPAPRMTNSAVSDTVAPAPGPLASPGSSGAQEDPAYRILAAITNDATMQGADVSVASESGVVRLAGTVRSREQVAIATGIAQRTEGVSRVESSIVVR